MSVCFTLSTLAPGSHAQDAPPGSLVRGLVVDDSTGAPLSHAHVQIAGTYLGAAANDEGAFVLRVASFPVTLRAGRLGYRTGTFRLTRPDSLVRLGLEPAVFQLGEVVVDAGYAEQLVRNAYEHCRDRHDTVARGRAFYRQLTRSDSVYTEWIETFYDTAVSCEGIRGWEVEHGRYALRDDFLEQDYANHRDFFALTRGLTPVQRHRSPAFGAFLPVRRHAGRRFDFTLEGRTEIDGRRIARIRYTPKPRRWPAFEGTVYIDEDRFTLYRLEGTIHRRRFRPLSWSGRDRRHRLENQRLTFEIDFREIDGVHVPSRIHLEASYDHVKGRAFERRVTARSTLAFYDYEPGFRAARLRHRTTDDVSDYVEIDRSRYDPEFWKDHPILAENPVETAVRRAFESTDSFGTLFGGDPRPQW